MHAQETGLAVALPNGVGESPMVVFITTVLTARAKQPRIRMYA